MKYRISNITSQITDSNQEQLFDFMNFANYNNSNYISQSSIFTDIWKWSLL